MKTADWRLMIGVLAVVTAGCSKPAVEEVQTSAAATVKTLALAPQTIEGVVAAAGLVAAAPGADWVITAPEPARIVELPKGEGDRVNPGDLLVRFEIPSRTTDVAARKAEVDQARAHVENAQAAVKRLTTLVRARRRRAEGARGRQARSRRSPGGAGPGRVGQRGRGRPRRQVDRPGAVRRRHRQARAQSRRHGRSDLGGSHPARGRPVEAPGSGRGADSRSRAGAGRQAGARAGPRRRRSRGRESADPSGGRRSRPASRPTCGSRSTR